MSEEKEQENLTLQKTDAAVVLRYKGEEEQPKVEVYLPQQKDDEQAPNTSYMAAFIIHLIGRGDLQDEFEEFMEKTNED